MPILYACTIICTDTYTRSYSTFKYHLINGQTALMGTHLHLIIITLQSFSNQLPNQHLDYNPTIIQEPFHKTALQCIFSMPLMMTMLGPTFPPQSSKIVLLRVKGAGRLQGQNRQTLLFSLAQEYTIISSLNRKDSFHLTEEKCHSEWYSQNTGTTGPESYLESSLLCQHDLFSSIGGHT